VTEAFLVPSRQDGAQLTLRGLDRTHYIADLQAPGLTATANVLRYMSEGLGDFFRDLAVEYRGWKGVKTWSSLESEITLEAVSDRTGHVFLTVALQRDAERTWTAEALLVLEAGQLDSLARKARTFEQSFLTS
jgi:hypothetical protein